METTKRVRLIIDAEIRQDSDLTPEVLLRGSHRTSLSQLDSPDWQENIRANQALLEALLRNPAVYSEWLIRCIEAELSGLNGDDFKRLANITTAGYDSLEQLIPLLPGEARQFWEDAQQHDAFSDCNDFTYSATRTRLLGIRLESQE